MQTPYISNTGISSAAICITCVTIGTFLSQMQNGMAVVSADYQGTTDLLPSFTIRLVPETDQATGEQASVFYMWVERYLFSRRGEAPMQNGPAWYFTPADLNACVEIRQGTPGRYSVLWKQGDAIPEASAEMEAYFGWLDQVIHSFDDRMSETANGEAVDGEPGVPKGPSRLYSQQKLLHSQVPEWRPWVEGAVDTLIVGIHRGLTEEIARLVTD